MTTQHRPAAHRSRPAHHLLLLAVLVLALAATACGGEDAAAADDGVATLVSGEDAAATADTADDAGEDEEVTEEELLAWVECMRGEGVEIDDPTVDADGNLTLAPAGGGARPAAGAGEGGGFDREAQQAATEACGQPPLQRGGFEFSDEDLTAMQDAQLAFAQCMRDLGHDVADPSFDEGPGAGRGLFGDLDMQDPAVQADLETCQTGAFGEDGPQFGGGRGAGPGGQGQ